MFRNAHINFAVLGTAPAVHRDWVGREATAATAQLAAEIAEIAESRRAAADNWVDAQMIIGGH
jgi:hypothetical protein